MPLKVILNETEDGVEASSPSQKDVPGNLIFQDFPIHVR